MRKGIVRLEVPFEKQDVNKPYCGPVCMAMLLSYYGCNLDQYDFARTWKMENNEPRDGIGVEEIISKFKNFKNVIIDKMNHATIDDILDYLDYKIPVCVVTSWKIDDKLALHYELVVGYNMYTKHLMLHNHIFGTVDFSSVSYENFKKLWGVKEDGYSSYDNLMFTIVPKFILKKSAKNLATRAHLKNVTLQKV